MLVTVRGIVVSLKDAGENDRILKIITDDLGVISIYARGVRKLNGKNSSAAQLFAYARFCLNEVGDRYYLESSETICVFYDLRSDLKRLALASYLADVVKYAVMAGQPSSETMQLLLNSLSFLSEGTRSCDLLKSVFEFRFACCTGHMPRLMGCDECYAYEADEMYFAFEEGKLYCGEHISCCSTDHIRIAPVVLHTIRYICLSDFKKIFYFDLKGKSLSELNIISERYLLGVLHHEQGFGTLDFYRSMLE